MRLKFWNRKESVIITATIDDVKDCLKNKHGFTQNKIDKLIEYGLDNQINSYIKTYNETAAGCALMIIDWIEESYLLDDLAATED